ncbi:MAG: 50S ribosomal protein L3 [Mycoplasma sp.]|nr:50S ribosomal protein L3 [Mycoplasma sp.]
MKYIIGRKLGMVQVFGIDGKLFPTTVVQCKDNKVINKKNNSITVGFQEINEKKLNKPQKGYFKKLGVKPYKLIAEFSNIDASINTNDVINVNTFKKGEYVDIQGITKGRGYTGAIVRWNFKIGPMSHGSGYLHRYQGSVAFGRGGSQGQRVPKGKKMAGHYGHETVTTENLLILDLIPKYNVILILGAIPGPKNGIVIIKSSIKKPNEKKEYTIISKEIKEDILKANVALEDKEAVFEANKEAEAAEKKKEEAEAAKKTKAKTTDVKKPEGAKK